MGHKDPQKASKKGLFLLEKHTSRTLAYFQLADKHNGISIIMQNENFFAVKKFAELPN